MTHDNEVFEDDDAAAIYDNFNRWSANDDFYLDLACKTGGHVLDLGCGAGMLACRVAAAGCRVTGVDPAEAMTRTIVDTPEHGCIEQSFDASVDDDLGIVDIAPHERYLDNGTNRIGRSRIRFVARDHLERLLTRAGLAALAWYGDWHRRPFTPASAEIVVVARRADR